jgi:hypothetical protein
MGASRQTFFAALALAGIAALAVALLAAYTGGFARSAQSTADLRDGAAPAQIDSPEPPPPVNRWIDPATGEFIVGVYDDRHMSEEDKAKDPVYDPRWDPFAACVRQEGYEPLSPGSPWFVQADMDALLARVNAERPDTTANRRVNTGDSLPGLAGAFLKCADEWLALTPEQAKANGFQEGKRSAP